MVSVAGKTSLDGGVVSVTVGEVVGAWVVGTKLGLHVVGRRVGTVDGVAVEGISDDGTEVVGL